MNCTHCNKRLSRKTARQIDGVIMCSTCMFKPVSERTRGIETRRAETEGLGAQHDSPVGASRCPMKPGLNV